MADPFKLLVLPGDGIGPEVVSTALKVFEKLCRFEQIETEIKHDLLHGAAWEKYGSFCRDETVLTAQQSDAVLIGAVGGVEWDNLPPEGATPAERDGLMRMREELQTYACLRPSRAYPSLIDRTPFKAEVVAGADVLAAHHPFSILLAGHGLYRRLDLYLAQRGQERNVGGHAVPVYCAAGRHPAASRR